jgi:hypothetical protein
LAFAVFFISTSSGRGSCSLSAFPLCSGVEALFFIFILESFESSPEQRGKADKEQEPLPEEVEMKKTAKAKVESGPRTPEPDWKRASTPEQRGRTDKRD